MQMSSYERLSRQARGLDVDRIPSIGGWIMGVSNLADLAGISVETYLADPYQGVVKANLALGVDGMIDPAVPTDIKAVRTGAVTENAYDGIEPEALVEHADSLPDDEKSILATFDRVDAERRLRGYFETAFAKRGGIVPVPNFWDLGGHFPLYHQFGYTAFLSACALYPDAVHKIWWARSLHSRERARILCGLYAEMLLPPLLFCGEDLCTNQGPLLSPKFLRKHYFPTVAMIIECLVDAGVRVVHHCDGDVRPLLQDFIDMGFSGFQGFQYEDHIDVAEMHAMRSRLGEEMLIFGGLSVSRTLPFGAAGDVQDEVDFLIDATDGGRGLYLITSNITGVEVQPSNIRAGYTHVKAYDPAQPRPPRFLSWPWGAAHPDCYSTHQ